MDKMNLEGHISILHQDLVVLNITVMDPIYKSLVASLCILSVPHLSIIQMLQECTVETFVVFPSDDLEQEHSLLLRKNNQGHSGKK